MAIDVSNSMRGERFAQAKQAAKAFLNAAPADVLVGIVAFAGDVRTVQEPTLDREELSQVVDALTLSRQTRLYDGVSKAVNAAGEEGQRSVLVLSDGKDTSDTAVDEVMKAIRDAAIQVDVVALQQSADALEPLENMAASGDGAVLEADDPQALVEVFSDQAADLAGQILVTIAVPDDLSGTEGTVAVSIDAGGEAYTGTAYVTLKKTEATRPAAKAPTKVAPPRAQVSEALMRVGLGAAGLGVLVVLLIALGVVGREKKQTLQDRVGAYSRSGDLRSRGSKANVHTGPPKGVTGSAIGIAEKALAGNKGFDATLGVKLDSAGLSFKPAEWLLLHAGIAIGAALMGFLLSGGGVLMSLALFGAGVLVPWVYLGLKKSRRLRAFNTGLAESLQLISGGLSAGLSLAQSIDTVVREGSQPIAGEFQRALVESRLGVQLEDALESVGSRMESADFNWIVMAIRIQREVGGNLAELLLSVAETLRERDYLRRQVKSLSAEGRLSAWMLGALPVGLLMYMAVANRPYVEPMFTNPIGWVMLAMMLILNAVGFFWMSRMVKVVI